MGVSWAQLGSLNAAAGGPAGRPARRPACRSLTVQSAGTTVTLAPLAGPHRHPRRAAHRRRGRRLLARVPDGPPRRTPGSRPASPFAWTPACCCAGRQPARHAVLTDAVAAAGWDADLQTALPVGPTVRFGGTSRGVCAACRPAGRRPARRRRCCSTAPGVPAAAGWDADLQAALPVGSRCRCPAATSRWSCGASRRPARSSTSSPSPRPHRCPRARRRPCGGHGDVRTGAAPVAEAAAPAAPALALPAVHRTAATPSLESAAEAPAPLRRRWPARSSPGAAPRRARLRRRAVRLR